jgi:hypothetical protein
MKCCAMPTFEQFLHDTATKGEVINTLFEERLFALVALLQKIADPFAAEKIPYELVGGMAVLAQVQRVAPDEIRLTKDVDIMIYRSDLERVKDVAQRHGFRFHHAAGLDMPLFGEEKKARRGVHLIFSGEKVRVNQATPNPPIQPERISIHGTDVWVIPVADLVRMKLSSYRDADRVHVRDMDAVGLITPAVEGTLSGELRSRLQHVRETE